MNTLVAWIGRTDLNACEGSTGSLGPIAGLLQSRIVQFNSVLLLGAGYSSAQLSGYVRWLTRNAKPIDIILYNTHLPPNSVSDYSRLLIAASDALNSLVQKQRSGQLSYHLSPGTPAMTVISVLLSQTRYPGRTYQTHFDQSTGQQRSEEVVLAPLWLSVVPQVLTAATAAHGQVPSHDLITADPRLLEAIAHVRLAASVTNAPILVCGDTGTGKEALARLAHESSGVAGDFVSVNCGAIPADLFESTFFGHRRGAFTGAVADQAGLFAAANNGTLFLDEISELRPEHQVKLLRAIQPANGKFEYCVVGETKARRSRIQLVAACNRDLRKLALGGAFREDLYYRLSTIEIKIPSLRDRPNDIELFIVKGLPALLESAFGPGHRAARPFSTPAMKLLTKPGAFPGNYRSLQRLLIRLHLAPTNVEVGADELLAMEDFGGPAERAGEAVGVAPLNSYGDTIARVQSEFLLRAWRAADGNKEAAARLLGLNSGTVFANTAKRLGVRLERRLEN